MTDDDGWRRLVIFPVGPNHGDLSADTICRWAHAYGYALEEVDLRVTATIEDEPAVELWVHRDVIDAAVTPVIRMQWVSKRGDVVDSVSPRLSGEAQR